MFYIANYQTNKWAHEASKGQHDCKVTDTLVDAAAFDTFGEASDYSQNFGDDWQVVEL